MTDWLSDNWLELFGVVSTIVYLILSIRQSIWLWPLGALSSAIYIAVYFLNKFYADMGLQSYYLIISIYGFIAWTRHQSQSGTAVAVCRTTGRQWLALGAVTAAIWGALYAILTTLTDSPVPVGDSFTTALAITATWMLTRKMIEQWLVFIVADAVSVALYFTRTMPLTAYLYIIYTTMAVVGYLKWRKELIQR